MTLLAACGSTHGKSHGDLAMVALVGALIALAAAIMLGSAFGPFCIAPRGDMSELTIVLALLAAATLIFAVNKPVWTWSR